MSTAKITQTSQISQDALNDPLRTFNEAAWRKSYGLGSNVHVDPLSGDVSVSKPKEDSSKGKKSSYQSGSPTSKMNSQLSGKPKSYRYSKSGVILSDGIDTGAGKNLLTSEQRVKALGYRGSYDAAKKVWAPDLLASSPYFKSREAHGASLFKGQNDRTPSKPQRAAGARKADDGVKVPGFKLETSGPGRFKEGTFYRDREYRLSPEKKD